MFKLTYVPVKSNRTPKAMTRRPWGVVKYRCVTPGYSYWPVSRLNILTLDVTYLSPHFVAYSLNIWYATSDTYSS